MDRERMLDMEHRLKPVRRASMAVLAVVLLASGPWIGWWTIIPLLMAAALFPLADAGVKGSARPEYLMFAAWAGQEVIIAAAVAITGGPNIATLSWLAIPVVTLSARFSQRGVVMGVSTALGLLLIVACGTAPEAVLHSPPLILAPAALIITVAMLSTALMHSDLHHRGEAVIDQLTGMLNRKALANRTVELAQQSVLTGEPIGLILGDLDHFKEVNDTHGHVTGDAVLTDVAYLLRKRLRAFDLAYRIGGEEFLVVLPGAGVEQARELADELRATVRSGTVGGGLGVTMSFGVTASPGGTRFDYPTVFAQCDAALYEAKRRGRDRVCTAADVGPADEDPLPVARAS
jgi:diguanylate cyclase (GGDEF)-like protein